MSAQDEQRRFSRLNEIDWYIARSVVYVINVVRVRPPVMHRPFYAQLHAAPPIVCTVACTVSPPAHEVP